VPVIKGKDVIAQAQFGTGKTVAFAISILQRINLDDTDCQALILAPTRELAQQIQKVRSCVPVGVARRQCKRRGCSALLWVWNLRFARNEAVVVTLYPSPPLSVLPHLRRSSPPSAST